MSTYGYGPNPRQTPVRPRTPIAPRPDNRGGARGPAPAFPSLAGPTRPDNRAGPLGPDPLQRVLMPKPPTTHYGAASTPPLPTPPVQAPPVANPAPVTPNVSYNYNTDPILQQAQAISTRNRGDAQSAALAARKQLAVDYNDVNLANSLGDPNTAQAAQGNQFGVLEQLKHNYDAGAHNLDEQLNNQNGFYSGHRVQEQGNLAHDYQAQQYAAARQEQGLLGGIDSNLLQAMNTADASDIAASQDAAARAQAVAIAYGIDPGAGGAGTTPPPPTAAAGVYGIGGTAPSFDPSTIFPTAGTPLVDPSLFPAATAPTDPVAAALAGLTPQQRKLLGL